jgi:hypothetical protein
LKHFQQWLIRFMVLGAAVILLLHQQMAAQAKICYDASKNVIPCPKSDYQLTQDAAKLQGSDTPVPDTATFTPVPPTATYTPVPPTFTPTATDTPVAAVVMPPVAPPAAPQFPWLLLVVGGGGAGLGTILLTQSRRRRSGGGKAGGTSGSAGTGPARMLSHKVEASSGSVEGPAPASTGPVRVGWMDIQHPTNPDQLGAYDINGVSSRGMGVLRDATTGQPVGFWGSWIDGDGKEHSLSPNAQDDYIKKAADAAGDNPGGDLSQADLDAGQAKQDILAGEGGEFVKKGVDAASENPMGALSTADAADSLAKQEVITNDLSQADLDASQAKQDILAGGARATDKVIFRPVDQEYIDGVGRRENNGQVVNKEGSIGGLDDGDTPGVGHESGHSSGVSGDGYSSTNSGDGNDGKVKPKEGGDGGPSGGSDSSDGKDKPKGGDDGGKGDGSDTSDAKPEKPKGGDDSMGGPDGDGDGNRGGHPGMFGGGPGGTSPEGDFERASRLGRGVVTGGDPGTGSGTGGEGGLDTNTGGQVGGLRPGSGGGRLAPSEGVGTNTGDPVA